MKLSPSILIALATVAVVGGCQSGSERDRLARATPPPIEGTPSASTTAPSAPTAPTSSSSAASSADTSMTGATPPAKPGAGADVSGTTATPGAPATAPPPAAVALSEVKNPKTTLKGAKVMDMKGEAIGEVKTVKVDAAGKVTALDVTVGKRTIALQADGVRYVAADKTLISDRPKADIVR